MTYREKMKKLFMFSLIRSCFYLDACNISIYMYDMEMKQINRHVSGQVLELTLKPCEF